MQMRQTDDIGPRFDFPSPKQEPEPITRLIDIHVYDLPAEPQEAPCVESELEEPEPLDADPDEPEQPEPEPICPRRSKRSAIPLIALASLALLSITLAVLLFPMLTEPTATVTIVPASKQIATTSMLTITTGQGPQGTIIPGRTLAVITMSQARTAPATGIAHQDAQSARGSITLYNAAPVAQTVSAGTLLTGADGIQIVTEQDAIIPAALPPTEGQATVAAHAVITGPAGNLPARAIYGPCCRLNVFAVSGPFHGGENARSYPTVTQQDITSVTSSLKTSLDQSVQAALQTQVQDTETLITPVPCQQSVTADHHLEHCS